MTKFEFNQTISSRLNANVTFRWDKQHGTKYVEAQFDNFVLTCEYHGEYSANNARAILDYFQHQILLRYIDNGNFCYGNGDRKDGRFA